MRRLIAAVAVLVVAGLFVWAFAPRPIPVETVRIGPQSVAVTVREEGEARIREVFTLSATTTGQLKRLALHAGDPVTADQTVVATIGPTEPALLDARARAVAEAAVEAAISAVDLAGAEVEQAQAALDFAASDAERATQIFDRGASSRRTLDEALLGRRTAQAALDSAQANLNLRQRELDSARAVLGASGSSGTGTCCIEIKAPVSGTVLRVLTDDAQVVQPGTPIAEIGDPANLEIVAELLSRDAVRVKPGDPAHVTGWGGPDLDAVVERVEPMAMTQVSALGIEEQRVQVILRLTASPSRWIGLGHGFRVLVAIEVWRGDGVLAIPTAALFRDGVDWATFVVDKGRARLRRITLGERNADFAVVLDGVPDGAEVILHPGDQVTDGIRVTSAGPA
ncbi:HlyD family efflux transporter periplasmic adaptor subunit [bacterium]|nr:HlyD family efflux transporter periplasmic adaptor subunit [bacterium]